MRIIRWIAIFNRVAETLLFEHAARFAIDKAEKRSFHNRPRLPAELIVDTARACRNRSKQRTLAISSILSDQCAVQIQQNGVGVITYTGKNGLGQMSICISSYRTAGVRRCRHRRDK